MNNLFDLFNKNTKSEYIDYSKFDKPNAQQNIDYTNDCIRIKNALVDVINNEFAIKKDDVTGKRFQLENNWITNTSVMSHPLILKRCNIDIELAEKELTRIIEHKDANIKIFMNYIPNTNINYEMEISLCDPDT